MVEQNDNIYTCPYCDSDFDEYSDAEECAEECHMQNVQSPIENKREFICKYCDNKYTPYKYAEDCEKMHVKNKDIYYHNYMQRKSLELLAKAAAHPSQQNLITIITLDTQEITR